MLKPLRQILIIKSIIFAVLTAQAQTAPPKSWDKSTGSGAEDKMYSFQQTADGGFILGGRSNGHISGDKTQPLHGSSAGNVGDYWIVKFDAFMSPEWDKDYGGIQDEMLKKVRQTADGGYIVGGWSKSAASGNKFQTNKGLSDYWVLKLNAGGAKLWEIGLGGNYDDVLQDIQQTADGGYIVGGSSMSLVNVDKTQAPKGSYDYWVIKLDANGNKVWDKTIGGSSNETLMTVNQTSDGGYLLGGYSISPVSGDKTVPLKGANDFWLVKLDANGNKIWDKAYGGNSDDIFTTLEFTSDGGYILGGSSLSGISGDKSQANKGNLDYWVIKLDASFVKEWDKTFGGSAQDSFADLKQTSDGGYLLGGSSLSGISGDKTQEQTFPVTNTSDYWVLKLDAAGIKVWDQIMGGNVNDHLTGLCQTSDGGYAFGGYSQSHTGIYKTDPTKGQYDYWIVKTPGTVTGINNQETDLGFTISPNPSQGRFNLQLQNLKMPLVQLTVTDLLGREIWSQELRVRNNQLNQELQLPVGKGVYFLQLKAGNQLVNRKIIIE